MKDQYFADSRDYFKYDLLLELLDTRAFAGGLTYIPMLTAPDGSGHGGLTSYECGSGRRVLYLFLQYCIEAKKRSIQQLRTFFGDLLYRYTPYQDKPCKDNDYFNHDDREAYFRDIPTSALARSLVFLDPDRGLEIKRMPQQHRDKYVLCDELRLLIDRMSDSSVMVVFQFVSRFWPMVDRPAYLSRICRDLAKKLAIADSVCVSDNQVAFFVIAKADHGSARARETVERYSERRGHPFFSV